MTRFARVIETTIYVKNSATKAGVGIGGEGHCTMTIAGPTGEGITCAKSFCRRRRCMLAEGGLRIISVFEGRNHHIQFFQCSDRRNNL